MLPLCPAALLSTDLLMEVVAKVHMAQAHMVRSVLTLAYQEPRSIVTVVAAVLATPRAAVGRKA